MGKNLVVVESPAKAKTIGKYLGADYRVMFNEITKRAVQEAFDEPKQIDQHLVDAQQARRLLDRLVGYKVSPLLCKTIGGRLSAGRVQSVALRMVVEREREIEQFTKTEYWTVTANLAAQLPPAFDARLLRIGEQTVKTGGFDQEIKKNEILIGNEAQAQEIVSEAQAQQFRVAEVTTKERKRNPVPSFITSKLHQEAASNLGYAVKRTMMIAQRLYEGVELGAEGSIGLITYMRTDSTRVSEAALHEVRDFVGTQYGTEYLPEKAIHYRSKKDAQDAHEAIRPTDVTRTPDAMAKYLNKEELKLYRLIWQRFVASQMTAAIFDQTT